MHVENTFSIHTCQVLRHARCLPSGVRPVLVPGGFLAPFAGLGLGGFCVLDALGKTSSRKLSMAALCNCLRVVGEGADDAAELTPLASSLAREFSALNFS